MRSGRVLLTLTLTYADITTDVAARATMENSRSLVALRNRVALVEWVRHREGEHAAYRRKLLTLTYVFSEANKEQGKLRWEETPVRLDCI